MSGSPLSARLDWVVPFPHSRSAVTDARSFRSTWLTSSQATLRERGYGPRYEAALAPEHKTQILASVPGQWLPMEVARAHYLACDALRLSNDELLDLGMAATRRANKTSLAFLARLAQGSGVTPWTVLAQSPRLWQNTCDGGGAVGVARLGPKEARVEVVGYPLASIRYNRVTLRGIALAVVELFCTRAYAREVAEWGDARSVGLRLSWV